MNLREKLLMKFLDSRYGYLYCLDNWHKHPWISKLMCELGRHDYELDSIESCRTVDLYCFYCGTTKTSTL